MAKKTKSENWRVTINPDDKYCHYWKDKEYREACGEIISQVKRHVDGIGWMGVERDTVEVCEHCGHGWELDAEGWPTCCQKAIDEVEASETKALPI